MTGQVEPDGQVAIIGMAALFPGAGSLAAYWHNLTTGVDAITDVPANRWDPEFFQVEAAEHRPDRVYCRRGGFVDDFAEIDPIRFGIMPTSVADAEPDQMIALRIAAAAIDDAGGPDRLPGADRVGVVLGRGGYQTPGQVRLDQRVRGVNQVLSVLRELLPEVSPERLGLVARQYRDQLGAHQPDAAIGLVPNLAASRVANRLNLRGPAYTVDAACASSLLAVDQAVSELGRGRCDVVLAGGVHHCHDIIFWSVFSQLKALSRRGESRPFDAGADGLLIGEGTGVVVLKRLADALRDGDRVYAVIRGTGVASDGRTTSLFNPDRAGQVTAVRRAWAAAGLEPGAPDSLGMLEAHGTATPTGDVVELATVAEVFGPARSGARPVIGSVKSMIGHTMPAAGIAGLIKSALAVYHGQLLPTLHCDDPRPELAATRFAPLSAARAWDLPGPRRAAVNAFGFGGINAHVVLEEAPSGSRTRRRSAAVAEEARMLWLHRSSAEEMARLLDADDALILAADCAGKAPDGPGCRLGIVGPTAERLAIARRVVARGRTWHAGRDIWFSPKPLLAGGGGIGFVFPGFEAEFAPKVDDVAVHLGLPCPKEVREDIAWQAAALFETSRLLHTALDRLGIDASAVAGHSMGEWTAMAAAGMFSDEQLDRLIASIDPARVDLPDVVFAVVGAAAERVRPMTAEYPGVTLSHDNAPAQCIICGPESHVARMVTRLQEDRILSAILPFRSGFHTPMFQPYIPAVRSVLELFEMRPATVPVWSATLAAPFPDEPDESRELFLRHLVEPVRFRETIAAMHDTGIRAFVQVGTGKLASVMQDILAGRDHLVVPMNVPHRSGLGQLARVATALWVEGGAPDRAVLRSPGEATAPARTKTGTPIKLDLGAALIRLGAGAPGLLQEPAERTGRPLGLLDRRRDASPVAVSNGGPAARTVPRGLPHVVARPRGPMPDDGGKTPGQSAEPEPAHRALLYVSTAAMPYLLDHCLFAQRADWPHTADRWPVVPATTMIRLMIQAAENVKPGTKAVTVRDARFEKWLIAAPPVDVELAATPSGPGQYKVRFGRYARATVEVNDEFPADRPAPHRFAPAEESLPEIAAHNLYTERWLFHGPQFQGLTQLLGIGERHVRAMITVPVVPGSLLDNVGQVLGYWMQSRQTHRVVIFPVGMKSIRFFGPRPEPGRKVECVVRIREITDSQVIADAQLIEDGRVWAAFDGWTDRRFDSHPRNKEATRFPQHYAYSDRQPEGWVALYDRWPDLATRELVARNMLGAEERLEYEKVPPRNRRQWLTGRIAAKDATRFHLWAGGADEVYPAEVRITNDAAGRPRARGWSGRDIGEFDLSLAHCAEVAVAVARRREPGDAHPEPGVGIDVEEIRPHLDSTVTFALSDGEQRLLSSRVAGADLRPEAWFVRFWAAKEAVAKAEGTGLEGKPRRFVVVAASAAALTVEVGGRRYQVLHRELSNPEDLPERRYVAAWTWGPEPEKGAAR